MMHISICHIDFKGIGNPIMTILSSFTHLHIVPNILHEFIFSVEHKGYSVLRIFFFFHFYKVNWLYQMKNYHV